MNRLDQAFACYQRMQGYQATIRSARRDGGEIIRYSYQRPGHVRMEFEDPHKGAVLVFDLESGRVRLWPFGIGWLPPMNLSPDNPLIQSPTGQRVDRSDIGSLLDNIRMLQKGGRVETLGTEKIGDRNATHVAVIGKSGAMIDHVHRYDIWFDDEIDFPIQVVSRDAENEIIETVLLEDVVIDPAFPPRFFTP